MIIQLFSFLHKNRNKNEKNYLLRSIEIIELKISVPKLYSS